MSTERKKTSRTRGLITILLSIFGMIIALAFCVSILLIRPNLLNQTKSLTESVSTTLTTTQSGLSLILGILDEVETSFEELEDTVSTLETSVKSLSPLISDVSELIGTDMVQIANDSQTTLESAAESSKLIESTLEALAKIPFVKLDYTPETPLHTNLENMAVNVGALPAVLTSIKTDLDQSAIDIETLSTDITDLSTQIGAIKTNLGDANSIIESYQEILTSVQSSFETAKTAIPGWINGIIIALVVLSDWLFLSQLMRFLDGLDYLKSGRIPKMPESSSMYPNQADEKD